MPIQPPQKYWRSGIVAVICDGIVSRTVWTHLTLQAVRAREQNIGVELDILKAVLQIDGIEVRGQIAIVDSDALQSANDRFKPNFL